MAMMRDAKNGHTDNVGALLGHPDQIPSWAMRELDGVHDTLGADNVGNVRDGRTGRRAEVQDFCAGADLSCQYRVYST